MALELLPEKSVKAVKLARSARRKLQQQFNATARLLGALDESVKLFQTSKTMPAKAKIDKIIGKISREEEKVLKFEQEVEKARLAVEVKKQKQSKKQQSSKEEQEKKNAAELEKMKAAEQRKKEKEEAKQKKALEREEAKRLKEEKALAEEAKKAQAEEKQKKRMLSFFGGGASKKAKKNYDKTTKQPAEKVSAESCKPVLQQKKEGFDSQRFRSRINSQGEVDESTESVFAALSKRASVSRRPKTKRVNMRVFVSGQNADDPFAAQPTFAEERIVEIRNRNKFLSFTEDCRYVKYLPSLPVCVCGWGFMCCL